MTIRTSWLLDTGQTREDTRLTQLGATVPADPLKVRTGILPGSADGVGPVAGFSLSDRTTMTATVQPGRAVVQGLANQGAYPVTLAEPVVLTFDDGDQQNRIDLVCIQLADASYSSSATSAALTVVKGTASATPQPPAVPDLALPLYNISVPAGASAGNTGIPWDSAVRDLRVSTVANGGVLPVYGNAAVPGSYTGQLRDHDGVIERWDGAGWTAYCEAIGGIIPPGSPAGATYVGQYRDSGGQLQRWNGAAWDTVLPAAGAFAYTWDAGWTQSTTYTNTLGDYTGVLAVNFTAPPTGAILVTLGAMIHTTSDATTTGYMSALVRQGGTVVSNPSDDLAAAATNSYYNSAVVTYRISGLTPGAASLATAFFRASAGANKTWFDNRYIRIEASV